MKPETPTHVVIDLTNKASVFEGTEKSCREFLEKQDDYFLYEILPLIQQETPTTEAKHTPGPWHLSKEETRVICANIPCDSSFVEIPIAYVCLTGSTVLAHEQAKANTSLLIAAPETAKERDQLKADNEILTTELMKALDALEKANAEIERLTINRANIIASAAKERDELKAEKEMFTIELMKLEADRDHLSIENVRLKTAKAQLMEALNAFIEEEGLRKVYDCYPKESSEKIHAVIASAKKQNQK